MIMENFEKYRQALSEQLKNEPDKKIRNGILENARITDEYKEARKDKLSIEIVDLDMEAEENKTLSAYLEHDKLLNIIINEKDPLKREQLISERNLFEKDNRLEPDPVKKEEILNYEMNRLSRGKLLDPTKINHVLNGFENKSMWKNLDKKIFQGIHVGSGWTKYLNDLSKPLIIMGTENIRFKEMLQLKIDAALADSQNYSQEDLQKDVERFAIPVKNYITWYEQNSNKHKRLWPKEKDIERLALEGHSEFYDIAICKEIVQCEIMLENKALYVENTTGKQISFVRGSRWKDVAECIIDLANSRVLFIN